MKTFGYNKDVHYSNWRHVHKTLYYVASA
jgi:hypothetical protein